MEAQDIILIPLWIIPFHYSQRIPTVEGAGEPLAKESACLGGEATTPALNRANLGLSLHGCAHIYTHFIGCEIEYFLNSHVIPLAKVFPSSSQTKFWSFSVFDSIKSSNRPAWYRNRVSFSWKLIVISSSPLSVIIIQITDEMSLLLQFVITTNDNLKTRNITTNHKHVCIFMCLLIFNVYACISIIHTSLLFLYSNT